MLPSLHEACGVFGVYAPDEDVARITFFGLYALQHRGQESAGIATSNSRTIYVKTGMGLVSQVFDEDDLSYLPGRFAIGLALALPVQFFWARFLFGRFERAVKVRPNSTEIRKP